MLERNPNASIDAATLADLEVAFLAAVVREPELLDRTRFLDEDAFTSVASAQIYSEMCEMHADGTSINLISLRRFAGAVFDSGNAVLDTLKRVGAEDADGDSLAVAIHDAAVRRAVANVGRDITGSVDNLKEPAVSLIDTAAARVDALQMKYRVGDAAPTDVAAIIEETLSIEDAPSTATGFKDLDSTLGGGFARSTCTFIASRPSVGKSAVISSAAANALANNIGVLCFSLEMPAKVCLARMACHRLYDPHPIDFADAINNKLVGEDRTQFEQAVRGFADQPLVIETRQGITVEDIKAQSRRVQAQFDTAGTPLGLIVVDYLGLVRPSSRYAGQKVHETTEVSNALCALSRTLAVPVVALHQLNRQSEQRDNKRPQLAELRDSGALEQDADAVLLLYRPSYHLERDRYDDADEERARQDQLERRRFDLEIQVAKNRNGKIGVVDVFYDPAKNAVRNKARYVEDSR